MKKALSNTLVYLPALAVVAAIVLLRLFVFAPYVIETGSMQPTLPVGTIVVTTPANTFKPTDIITFRQSTDAQPTTHTFIGYADDGSLRTKGDANQTPDFHAVPLQKSDVLGKVVFSIPFLVPSYWTSVKGVLSLLIVLAVLTAIVVIKVKDKREEQLEKETPREETPELTPSNH